MLPEVFETSRYFRRHDLLDEHATPARGPPQQDLLLDQTPSFDVTDPDPVPEIDLDQSLPEEFDD